VFVQGDKYFRTGDLLSRDAKGFFYFVDRIGDTFRWKGENVSTTEVAEVVSTFPGVAEANIYGVEVPGSQDGNACLASLQLVEGKDNMFDDATVREKLYAAVSKELPKYARPLFLRIQAAEASKTATFKQQKVELRKQGCDPSKCAPDKMFFLQNEKYVPLTPEIYNQGFKV